MRYAFLLVALLAIGCQKPADNSSTPEKPLNSVWKGTVRGEELDLRDEHEGMKEPVLYRTDGYCRTALVLSSEPGTNSGLISMPRSDWMGSSPTVDCSGNIRNYSYFKTPQFLIICKTYYCEIFE